jgi:putative sigma-54 modulation protein
MRVFIQTQGLKLSREDRDHIRQRLRQALTRFGSKAIGATLHIKDINGPRGGLDKDCHLVVELEDATTVVHDRGFQVRALVDRAVHRAVHAIGKQLARIRERGQRATSWARHSDAPQRNQRQVRARHALPDGA